MQPPVRHIRRVKRKLTGQDQTDEVLLALGALQCRLQSASPPSSLEEAEFKVFSQYGEDGAIQYLVNRIAVPDTSFVEIGVESYQESNTRFLALHSNWRGLAIDGSRDHIEFVEGTDLGWRVDVKPVQAFVTRENVNELLQSNGFTGEIGLLSLDVDGVDYWLLDAIEVVRPAILVLEYNSIFGPTHAVTVPYAPDFVCGEAHWSYQYFGASLSAMERLAARKGYSLVGVTTNALNALFVRNDLVGDLPTTTSEAVWKPSRFLSSRDETGALSRVRDHRDRLRLIRDLELVHVETDQRQTIAELYDV